MNTIRNILVFTILICVYSCQTSSDKTLVIDTKTTLFVGEDESPALKRAVNDLAKDMEKVFGVPYSVVNDLADCKQTTIIVALDTNIPIGLEKPEGWEKLLIKVKEKPFKNSSINQALVLTGSDKRGAIYAVYEFAEKFLDVDPLYWWTDNEPEKKEKVELPNSLILAHDSPTIKFRGLFINDEDLLSGWTPGAWRFGGISMETWDRIFEATLRMKGNMIIPGTFIFPYEPQVKAAGERGLIITQHHVEVLGLNVFRWPEDEPYSFLTNKEKLISAWNKAVEQYPEDQEILWTVGYRGKHDRPFWSDEANISNSKQARADIIKEAILTQMEIVKKHYKNPHFIMNTWGEGVEFVREGYLKIPDEVTLVWADKGWGIIRDGGTISEGQGMYYHTAMFNQRCNQLSEMIPVERIQKEIGRAVKAGADQYMLINCSDLRPVVMSTSAAMSLAWDASNWIKNDDYHNQYLKKWYSNQYGQEIADQVMDIYKRYEEVPIKYSGKEHHRFGDNYYHLLTRSYLRRMSSPGVETFIEPLGELDDHTANARLLIELAEKAIEPWNQLLQDAENLKASIPDERQGFYQAHILMPITIHTHSNKILLNIMKAFVSESTETQIDLIDSSMDEIPPMLASFKLAEYGKWKDFYRNDTMTGIRSTRKCLEITRRVINGVPNYENISDYIHIWEMWDMIKGYQGTQRVPI